jgi:ABC-type uncharacterized transport system permease subunit
MLPKPRFNNVMALTDPRHLLPMPPGVWITVGLAVVMALVMRETVYGRYVFAIGANETAARLFRDSRPAAENDHLRGSRTFFWSRRPDAAFRV